jgi:hypothetical protein
MGTDKENRARSKPWIAPDWFSKSIGMSSEFRKIRIDP